MNPQRETTRKFKKDADGRVVVAGSWGRTPTENPSVREAPYLSLCGGKHGYLWVGSEERGCYTHIPLSVLKRLIASAEAR